METETKTWLKLSNEGKIIVEQILAAEERTKSNKKEERNSNLGIIASDPSTNVNHLTYAIWDRKVVTKFTRSISFTEIG